MLQKEAMNLKQKNKDINRERTQNKLEYEKRVVMQKIDNQNQKL
jgi:ribosomal protein S30